MRPFDICDATQEFNGCLDRRPWLIIEEREGDLFGCFPISGEHYSRPHFCLDPKHPDFEGTGLTKLCFVLDERMHDVKKDKFQKHRGRLTGTLLVEFRAYADI